MPWKECSVMEERMRFIVRLLEGEEMSYLCREFEISAPWGARKLRELLIRKCWMLTRR
jgi:hypothetical protein